MENEEARLKFREKLLDTFYFTERFFKENNIRYYACGGTVLGAVRHEGLIPWDDDIDLYVPREDYDRLMLLNDSINEQGYNFVCFENNPDYYLPFGKIENNSTSLWEVERFKYVTGVYVDIFPLDYYPGSKDDVLHEQHRYKVFFRKYLRSIEYEPLSEIESLFIQGKRRMALSRLVSYFFHPFHSVLYKRLMREIAVARSREGEWCVCTPQWEGRVFRKEWFDQAIDFPFENTTIKVPRDYHAYLTSLYGDYMTLPPREKQVPHHIRRYLNLREKLSAKEVCKSVSRGEVLVF